MKGHLSGCSYVSSTPGSQDGTAVDTATCQLLTDRPVTDLVVE
jgi:hypothetical protein